MEGIFRCAGLREVVARRQVAERRASKSAFRPGPTVRAGGREPRGRYRVTPREVPRNPTFLTQEPQGKYRDVESGPSPPEGGKNEGPRASGLGRDSFRGGYAFFGVCVAEKRGMAPDRARSGSPSGSTRRRSPNCRPGAPGPRPQRGSDRVG